MLLSTPAGQCFPSRNSTATASRDSARETAICRTIEFAKLVWYGKGRVCRTNLSTQPEAQQPLPRPRAQQPLPQPEPSSRFHSRDSVRETAICRTIEFAKWVWYGKGRVCRTNLSTQPGPATTSAAPAPATTSASRAKQPLPQPGSSSHFRSPGPGPRAKATRYRKRGRFCTAGSCKRATELYLFRSRRRRNVQDWPVCHLLLQIPRSTSSESMSYRPY